MKKWRPWGASVHRGGHHGWNAVIIMAMNIICRTYQKQSMVVIIFNT